MGAVEKPRLDYHSPPTHSIVPTIPAGGLRTLGGLAGTRVRKTYKVPKRDPVSLAWRLAHACQTDERKQ